MRRKLFGWSLVALLGITSDGCGSNGPGNGDAAADAFDAPSDVADAFGPADQSCPPPTPPVTAATGPTDTISGLSAIPSGFDVDAGLKLNGGDGSIPPSAAPDVVGAFRFICGAGQLLYDDPIVYPCKPGVSHLHQFYGNTAANAYSTFESLRTTGMSTCANGTNSPVNRSGYWTPAMLDGKGNVVQPDWEAVYYKRRPLSDPKCSRTSGDPQAEGDCVPIPSGIQFTFGFDPTKVTSDKTGDPYFNCTGPGATGGHYPDIPSATAFCPVGSQILAVLDAPSCWDGKNVDMSDHRSHVSHPTYGTWGYLKCDDQHPFVIPTFHLAIAYTVAPGDDLSQWTLSSDTLAPNQPHGYTLHGDYKEAWDDTVKTMWTKGCVDGLLNCSGGDLGNGLQIIGAQQPAYGWTNPNHLVPLTSIPQTPMQDM
jgi:hypothetical protein